MEKKKGKITEQIEIPEGFEVDIGENSITIKKEGKEITRKIDSTIKLSKQEGKIIISSEKSAKKEKRIFGTIIGHIKNMVEGLSKGFEYDLEICNVHFPMTVTYDKAKKEFIIKNLLGEKHPRIIKASDKIEVEIKAPKIKIKSYDIEIAGQAATNLEKATRIRNRDRNKFQDGIFITKKPGKEYI